MVKIGTKYNGYQQYLRYKDIMSVVDTGEEFRREDLVKFGITYDNTFHVVTCLMKEGVIKVSRHDIINGHRKIFYKKVKN